jgi:hypothetical protein
VKKAGDYVFLSKKGREVVRQVGEVAEASRTAYTSAERNLSDTYRALTKESRSTLSSEIRKRIATLKTELAAELYDLQALRFGKLTPHLRSLAGQTGRVRNFRVYSLNTSGSGQR